MTPPFRVHRPDTTEEASALLSELDDGATPYCGGTELLQVMKMGVASFSDLIDLKAISELKGIEASDDGGVSIGASVTHREIERSALIMERLPSLAELERQVANVRVRNTGSIGGNLCFAEPHSDPATLLVAAGAQVHLADSSGTRAVPLEDFILGPLVTVREPYEIMTRIAVPPQPDGAVLGYRKIVFHERPVASVASRVIIREDRIESASIVVGAVGDRPTSNPAAARLLVGASVDDYAAEVQAAADLVASECDAYADSGGSEEYKRHLVAVLTRQAIGAALGRLQ